VNICCFSDKNIVSLNNFTINFSNSALSIEILNKTDDKNVN